MRLLPSVLMVGCLLVMACGGDKGGTDAGSQPRDAGKPLADGGPGVACGNGALESGEACDDGNTLGGDGCSAQCGVETGFECRDPGTPCTPLNGCGNAKLEGTEQCDDGNLVDHDGCSALCVLESGWYCPHAGLACHATCGDHLVAGNEQCDDGNTVAGDGCNARCQTEDGYRCSGGACAKVTCGNHVQEGAEECDDGNHDTGDGCSPLCELEPRCDGGTCAKGCGDGVLVAGEECDDGNLRGGDGCSDHCTVERDFTCAVSNSLPPGAMPLTLVTRDTCGYDVKVGGVLAACAHPDFQTFTGGTPTLGLVQSSLAADGKPACKTPVNKSMLTGCALFDHTWFHDVAATDRTADEVVNLTRVVSLPVSQQDTAYRYANDNFYPWDALGWVASGIERTRIGDDGAQHNFSFTTEARFWFTAQNKEQVSFKGDDDVWVFVNRKLALDLGGLHPESEGMVALSSLGLADGGTYEVAVFQAERHNGGSHYNLSLTGFGLRHSVCTSLCGNGKREADAGEQCDDGNVVSGDGCSATCFLE